MTGNVGGPDGNPIKVNTRKPLNLTKLDKLVGQSTEGSIWDGYDAVEKGGNGNGVFDASEINTIKTYLLNEQDIPADILAYFEEENIKLQDQEPKSSQPAKDTPPLPMSKKILLITQFNLAIHRKNLLINSDFRAKMQKPLLSI